MIKYLDNVPVMFYGHSIYYSPMMTRASLRLYNRTTKTTDTVRVFNIDSAVERLMMHYGFVQTREELYTGLHVIRDHLKEFSRNLLSIEQRRLVNGRSIALATYDDPEDYR